MIRVVREHRSRRRRSRANPIPRPTSSNSSKTTSRQNTEVERNIDCSGEQARHCVSKSRKRPPLRGYEFDMRLGLGRSSQSTDSAAQALSGVLTWKERLPPPRPKKVIKRKVGPRPRPTTATALFPAKPNPSPETRAAAVETRSFSRVQPARVKFGTEGRNLVRSREHANRGAIKTKPGAH